MGSARLGLTVRALVRPLRPVGEAAAGDPGVRVFGAKDPLVYGQQRGEQAPRRSQLPRLPGPVGQVVPGGQGVRVLWAEDLVGSENPLACEQQRGELVAGPRRVPRARTSGRHPERRFCAQPFSPRYREPGAGRS